MSAPPPPAADRGRATGAAPAVRPEDVTARARILQDRRDAMPWAPDLHTIEETESSVRHDLVAKAKALLADGDRVMGFAARTGGTIPALHGDACARGRGVGSVMVRAARARAPRLRVRAFRGDDEARRLSRRCGFAEGRTAEGDDDRLRDAGPISEHGV